MPRKPKTLPIDYVAKVTALDWQALSDLWDEISAVPRTTAVGWAAGMAFEHLILRAFQLSGAEVVWPYAVKIHDEPIEQIDGLVISGHLTCMVEAKDEATNIAIAPLAKLRNQLMRRPSGVVGSVFTSRDFTAPAVTLAYYMAPQAILLWTGIEISHLLQKQDFVEALKWKHRVLLQHGMPDYNSIAGAPS